MKRIGVITNSNSKVALHIKNNLVRIFGDQVTIRNYYLEALPDEPIDDDVVVVMIKEMGLNVINQLTNKDALVTIQRTVKATPLLKVFSIPENMEVLVVNDTYETTLETITLLYQLGVNHIQLVPYKEGCDFSAISVAITPDELAHVPKHVTSVINIEQRVIDISTFIQIMNKLELNHQDSYRRLLDYSGEIVSLSAGVNRTLLELYSKNEELITLLNLSNDGIVLTDGWGKIIQVNQVFEKQFSVLDYEDTLSACFGEVFAKDFKQESIDEKLYTLNGREFLVSKRTIHYYGTNSGYSYIFRDVTEVKSLESSLQQQMKTKGLIAKYTFDDISTNEKSMMKTIDVAKKMASSDLSVLITGESGTGKELFAQSIHNASERSNYPFVAINCAAMSESLLESELFGYEGGAFTGALKQGKPGLFEQAHLGTIFLDEIGDMPLAMQSRLLRVLQERQVMRVGGKKVIDIDVRVIAATHKDLYELVEKRVFRQDLYFRINVLPLMILPLSSRREDILMLLRQFSQEHIELSSDVERFLVNYTWKGNIRELKNISSYLGFIDHSPISMEDLPPYMMRHIDDGYLEPVSSQQVREHVEGVSVETVLCRLYEQGIWAGRMKIRELCSAQGCFVTEAEVRKILQTLKENNHLSVKEGRGGSMLTREGYELLKQI